jgi:glutathione S-transferase
MTGRGPSGATGDPTEHLFHVALAAEWDAALCGAGYDTSTLGRTVAEEGYTHCARRHQVAGVIARHYADAAEPLVLLELDPALLTSPVVDEVPPGAPQAFPHVYGPLDVVAVMAVHPLARGHDGTVVLPDVVSGSRPSGPSS